jgi:hypothetical protein
VSVMCVVCVRVVPLQETAKHLVSKIARQGTQIWTTTIMDSLMLLFCVAQKTGACSDMISIQSPRGWHRNNRNTRKSIRPHTCTSHACDIHANTLRISNENFTKRINRYIMNGTNKTWRSTPLLNACEAPDWGTPLFGWGCGRERQINVFFTLYVFSYTSHL